MVFSTGVQLSSRRGVFVLGYTTKTGYTSLQKPLAERGTLQYLGFLVSWNASLLQGSHFPVRKLDQRGSETAHRSLLQLVAHHGNPSLSRRCRWQYQRPLFFFFSFMFFVCKMKPNIASRPLIIQSQLKSPANY